MGPTRSVRLPRALDEWFVQRLSRHIERSPSEMLVHLVHGGLRLREGYMAIHRRVLEAHQASGNARDYDVYVRCLTDTFGEQYVSHLERWLDADRISPADASSINGMTASKGTAKNNGTTTSNSTAANNGTTTSNGTAANSGTTANNRTAANNRTTASNGTAGNTGATASNKTTMPLASDRRPKG